jgi:hypothetical protein
MEHPSPHTVTEVNNYLYKDYEGALQYVAHGPPVLRSGDPLQRASGRAWTAAISGLFAGSWLPQDPGMQHRALHSLTTYLEQNPSLKTDAIAKRLGPDSANNTLRDRFAAADAQNFRIGFEVAKQLKNDPNVRADIELARRLFSPQGKGMAIPVDVVKEPRASDPKGLVMSKPADPSIYQNVLKSLTQNSWNRLQTPSTIAQGNTCSQLRHLISEAGRDTKSIASLLQAAKKNNENGFNDDAHHQLSTANASSEGHLAAFKKWNSAETIKSCPQQDQKQFQRLIQKLNTLRDDTAKSLGERSAANDALTPAQARREALLRHGPVVKSLNGTPRLANGVA